MLSGGNALGQETAVRLDQQQAVERAVDRHPDLQLATAELEAAQAVRKSAGLPSSSPEITFEGGPRFGADRTELDFAVGLEQEIEFGGQASRRRQVASAKVTAAEARLDRVQLIVRTETQLAFAEAMGARSMMEQAEGTVALASEMLGVARRRHEAGETSVLEPNFAALELMSARSDLLRADSEKEERLQALRRWLALTGDVPLELTGEVSAPTKAPGELSELIERALQRRADLRDLAARRDAASAALRLEQASSAPDIGLSLGYAREGSEAQVVTGGITIGLPLFQRNQVGIAEARGLLRASDLELETARAETTREIGRALAAWQAAAADYSIATSEALPLAQDNLGLLVLAYEAGKEGLLSVLLLQQQALAAQRDAVEATIELQRARTALEQAVGEELF